ncbi:MAG: PQQ-dependent sugar dehydrogenase [Anaerolineales bacterium]
MKRLLLVILAFSLTACLSTSTPPPPTPAPATVPPDTSEPPTAIPPTSNPGTELPPTDVPTDSPPPSPDATAFPNPDNYVWETIVSGLERPVDLQHAGDGSGRLFIIEKIGRIRVFQDGQLLDTPYLNITDRVGSGGNEQGLLGLAFHPNFEVNGLFFVNYTDTNGDTVIARYRVTGNPNAADPTGEVILLRLNQPFQNHNGGVLAFGPDGYLYAGLGDGGAAGDPQGNAQSLDTWLGKILRLDVDAAEPYAIPADNPFGNEIWAYGLRNPWRMSFDSQTGDLYIGDVGQNQWEEIDFVYAGTPGGLNFGWDYLEGTHPYEGSPPQDAQLVPPVAEYSHSEGGCSVTSGYVYRGAMPEWNGIYLYGDYCSGIVWGLIRSNGGWQNQVLYSGVGRITSFGQDEAGEIYLILDSGQILQLSPQ